MIANENNSQCSWCQRHMFTAASHLSVVKAGYSGQHHDQLCFQCQAALERLKVDRATAAS